MINALLSSVLLVAEETNEVITAILITLLVILLCIFFYYVPFMLWINAAVSGVRISLVQLFLMRRTSP